MKQYLANSGYEVDVYSGANVTIDLMKSIGGYKILILRLHSSITKDGLLYLFSGEQYTESKYLDDQLAGIVRKAGTFDRNESKYFALGGVFFGRSASNNLKDTTLITMGCNGSGTPYDIQDFFQRGVKDYISWDGFVDLPHSDEATLRLIKAMCVEGLNATAAVEEVNREVGPDPFYKSKLIYMSP